MKTQEVTAHLLKAGTLFLGDARGKEVGYWLDALPHDLGPDIKCYRLRKLLADRVEGEPDEYDVQLSAEPDKCVCECKGYLRWSKCKHITGLLQLMSEGKLP